MAILTEKTRLKNERNLKIKSSYKELMKQKGSQRYAVYELLAKEHGCASTTIGRIVGNIKSTN